MIDRAFKPCSDNLYVSQVFPMHKQRIKYLLFICIQLSFLSCVSTLPPQKNISETEEKELKRALFTVLDTVDIDSTKYQEFYDTKLLEWLGDNSDSVSVDSVQLLIIKRRIESEFKEKEAYKKGIQDAQKDVLDGKLKLKSSADIIIARVEAPLKTPFLFKIIDTFCYQHILEVILETEYDVQLERPSGYYARSYTSGYNSISEAVINLFYGTEVREDANNKVASYILNYGWKNRKKWKPHKI